MPQQIHNWPWLTLQIIGANIAIVLALALAWYLAFMRQSSVYSDRLMSTFNIEPGSLHAMYVDDVEKQLWISVGLGLVIATLASVSLALLIVRPIKSLAGATERLRHGDYTVRSQVETGEVGRLAEIFNSLAEKLEQEEKRRTQFLNDLGHELRTPITSLRGYTEGLEDGVFQPNTDYFKLMTGELSHLSALTHTIETMQLGALADNYRDSEPHSPVKILLSGAKDRWFNRFQQRKLNLQIQISKGLDGCQLDISAQSLKQIIDNLLSNMYRYACPGEPCIIEVSKDKKTGHVGLVFSNMATDIQEECLPFLFDRFYRVSESRTRVDTEHPSGLGLAVVKKLCLLNQGTVVASLTGSRLFISVYLPVLT